ncbi:MAG: DUF362 domain-containing protein, partial [Spirochaetaceae bacterium]|nr:DUF362 domain-containing protein [Spirochaetaceae bacterium]
GDSPGWQPQDLVGRLTGAREAAETAGAEWVDFSEGVEFEAPAGRIAKRFRFAKSLAETDLLVSLPKLKTHQLMYYTGAIKNLFGLVPGLEKSAFHLRFPGRAEFATMLADLVLAARPDFSLMDAVVAMEGPGPNNGRPRRLGLVMASRDPLALDWSAAGLIGYEPRQIAYLAELMDRLAAARAAPGGEPRQAGTRAAAGEGTAFRRGAGLPEWAASPADIAVAGVAVAEAKPDSFELVPVLGKNDFLAEKLPPWLHRLVKGFMVPRPRFIDAKCVACAGCVRICPAKALELAPGRAGKRRVKLDHEACIRCYCCHEICPEDAIALVRRP